VTGQQAQIEPGGLTLKEPGQKVWISETRRDSFGRCAFVMPSLASLLSLGPACEEEASGAITGRLAIARGGLHLDRSLEHYPKAE